MEGDATLRRNSVTLCSGIVGSTTVWDWMEVSSTRLFGGEMGLEITVNANDRYSAFMYTLSANVT